MKHISKLKPDNTITGLIQPLIAIFLFIILLLSTEIKWALFSLSVIYFLYTIQSILFTFKTNNLFFLIPGVFQICLGIYTLIVPKGLIPFEKNIADTFLVIAALFMVFSVYLMLSKKLKWKGREFFELAAENTSVKENSFTERPKPVSKTDVHFSDIIRYTTYLQKNLVGLCSFDENKVFFHPIKMGSEYGPLLIPNYEIKNKTWVSVSKEGEVIVHISKKDYLNFREDLAFNELCDNMGHVFLNFLEQFLNKEQIRIKDQLESVSNSIFA